MERIGIGEGDRVETPHGDVGVVAGFDTADDGSPVARVEHDAESAPNPGGYSIWAITELTRI